MPATEETYRRQPTLHIVFAVSSLAMTLVIVWMIMADHLRPWKRVQRDFHQVETAKLKKNEQDKLVEQRAKHERQIAAIDAQLKEVDARAATNARAIRDLGGTIDKLKGRFEKADTLKRFKKAELDSQRSFYDGMIDRGENSEARRYLTATIVPSEQQLMELSRQFEDAVQALNRAKLDRDLLGALWLEVSDVPPPGTLAALAGFKKGDMISVDDFKALREQIEAGSGGKAAVAGSNVTVKRRVEKKSGGKVVEVEENVPITASAQPPVGAPKAKGAAMAWDEFSLPVSAVTREFLAKQRDDLTRDADRIARSLKQKQEQYGEGGIYNAALAWFRGLPIIDLAAPPTKIQQISLPDLLINYNFKEVPRYDRCTTCHLGIDRLGYDTDAHGKAMDVVFRSHPHLTDGATAIDPKGNPVVAGLYLDGNGPHKINSFGCTICHGGQGSGTTFTYASHEPNDLHQKEEWGQNHGWYEIHHWDEPMLPKRFMESSCLKCHWQVTDVPQAEKLQRGYQRITKYGCTGCHQIGGEGTIGPDLTDNRPVGPNLVPIASKVSKDWTLKWIRNPHAFRPDTRMPRFYDVTNNSASDDQPKVSAEVHAITHYLFENSAPPSGFVDPPVAGDATRGKEAFLSKGCVACHTHKDFAAETFPKSVQQYAGASFGPNLSNIAAKFPSAEAGYKWLANWVKDPAAYHPKSLMPTLQLTWQESSDIARWLISVPGEWPRPIDVPSVDSAEVKAGLDDLTKLYLTKSKVYKKRTVLRSEISGTVAAMSLDDKLTYVGEKTISRLGCFGCHTIKGFETAKPIGTPLAGWGFKNPAKLDFGHIKEYLDDNTKITDGVPSFDGTDPYYKEKVDEQKREGFLYQKLHRPRSYDYQKTKEDLKSWDDRLRMPQFAWANDPAAIEEVMTFVLGLTGERIPAKYLPRYGPDRLALARGERLVERYNCRGCHVFNMPRFTIPAGTKIAEALPDFQTNVEVSYGDRAKDYLSFYGGHNPAFPGGLAFDANKAPTLTADEGLTAITFEGMPTLQLDDEDDKGRPLKKLSIQLWRPVTIRGYAFNVGDRIVVNPERVQATNADGGNFAWLFAAVQADKTGTDFASFWNRLPPPLVREGLKVQTPWLTSFLKDPYSIRPAAQLRMPRFHFGSTVVPEAPAGDQPVSLVVTKAHQEVQDEVRDIANFFAVRDGAEFPYQDIPERDEAYLSQREAAHKDYLGGGWSIVTKGLCIQCHAIGQYKPTGGAAVVNGPDLRQVGARFRPRYLYEWLGQPNRMLPYTAMPQNIPPNPAPDAAPTPGVPPSFVGHPLEQVEAMRDMLLNYVSAIEQQLAGVAPPAAPAQQPPAAKAPGASGN